MRNLTLSAVNILGNKGTIRGGSFLSCLIVYYNFIMILHFSSDFS